MTNLKTVCRKFHNFDNQLGTVSAFRIENFYTFKNLKLVGVYLKSEIMV